MTRRNPGMDKGGKYVCFDQVEVMRDFFAIYGEPRYREVKKEQIPGVSIDKDIRARIISGELENVRGPVRDILVEPEYLDVKMAQGAEFEHHIKRGYRAFAYVIEGNGYFDQDKEKSIELDIAF